MSYFDRVQKANPYHGPDGRFTSKDKAKNRSAAAGELRNLRREVRHHEGLARALHGLGTSQQQTQLLGNAREARDRLSAARAKAKLLKMAFGGR